MTSPRVTVPVEDLAGKLKAIRDKFLMPTPDKDFTDYAVMTRCIDALSAAPAPEGGAVQWGWRVRAKPSRATSHRPWHWQADEPTETTAELCEWEPVYVALATREEAPAEAGEVFDNDVRDASFVELILRDTLRIRTGTFDGVRGSFIANIEEAAKHVADNAERLVSALRAQPQAREDAQPGQWGWRVRSKPSKTPSHRPWHWQADEPTGITAELCDYEPVFVTHPAPDALRVAVSDTMVEAACSRFVSESDDIWSASVWPEGPDDDGDRGDGGRVRLISEADQHNIRAAMRFAMTDALAALQAEQKGGV